jgi:membrane-associated phospholipid phosphatase
VPSAGPSLLAPLLSGLVASACAQDRVTRHFDAQPWRAGAAEQLTRPDRLVPEIAAASVALALIASDELDLVGDAELDHSAKSSDTQPADDARDALRWTALGWSAWSLADGDRGRALEVALETWALNTLATRGIKSLAGRERPNGSDDQSFPSGHASSAFSAATFLARSVDDAVEGPWGGIGYLAYLPAGFVAAHRVTSKVHYPSDAIAGALLGFVVANTVYDAHFGAGEGSSIFFGRRGGVAWSLTPAAVEDGVGFSLVVTF